MTENASRPPRIAQELLVVLGLAAVTAVIQYFVVNQRAFLNFYYLPVVYASYTLGLRKGFYSALASCGLVGAIALMNENVFVQHDHQDLFRWLDLGTWGCFLILTSYVVGSLIEIKEAQLRELQDAYQGILEIMAKFIDSIDRSTENHSRRVADRSVEVARALGLPDPEVENIRVGAFLHDIGKVEVSTEVLNKAANLTPEEHAEMRRHVDAGQEMVSRVGGILHHVIPIVLYHHERWDGTGYKGLVGESIPLGARIIAVADTYDAIVEDRPYRRGRSHDQAVAILQEESGKQFDPRIVAVFVKLYGAAEIAPAARAA